MKSHSITVFALCDLGLSHPSIVGADMNYNVVETSVSVWCILSNSVCDLTLASTLRLASMSEALAPGRQITFAGVCVLSLCLTASRFYPPEKKL